MGSHPIGLLGVLLLAFAAVFLLFLIGPFVLLLLILGVILFWYALGPGSRRASGAGSP